MNKQGAVIAYIPEGGATNVDITVQGDSVWATQKAISEIFDTDQSGIARHLT